MRSFDQRQLRDALGKFATGVTVVTTLAPEGPVGMTVNSFASVSLDPPLVLWSIARDSDRFAPFEAAEHFAIHVLPAGAAELALRFAAFGNAFEGLDCAGGVGGAPLLPVYTARFECRVAARHNGGDHLILVGEVLRLAIRDAAPLVFHGGRFAEIAGC